MGSTGEPDRKRRHFNSISPTANAAAAKKQPTYPSSEDKKLDVAVLQYQNQKLVQQLEAQKVEYFALDSKFHQLKDKQKTYSDTLVVVNKSWERVVGDLEARSTSSSGTKDSGNDLKSSHIVEDGASCPPADDFVSRLLDTGATESCSDDVSVNQLEVDIQAINSTTKTFLRNILASVTCMSHANAKFVAAVLSSLPEDDQNRQLSMITNELQLEVRNLQAVVGELHLKHRVLAGKVWDHQDADAKNKAELKRLAVELKNTVAELEESNNKLAILKTQRDPVQGTLFPFPSLGNKLVDGEKIRDKQKELQGLESTLREYMNLASSRLVQIRSLHEERIDILKKLANFQNVLTDAKSITSSKVFMLLSDQLVKSKEEIDQCWGSLEKLQVENDNFSWHEKEVALKINLADVSRRVSAFSESRVTDLEQKLQKLADEMVTLETKLEAASREPCRKEIIDEFKSLVLSLPKDIGVMQTELSKYKEAGSELHSLRAEVQSLSSILSRKTKEMEAFSGKSADRSSEINKLHRAVCDLRETDQELKLILEMYRRESTDSWDVLQSRDLEYKAWAHVQSLKSSLDEHSLELRVKAANEAEATAQQRLATAEAEIADLRQKLELSVRDARNLSETLKSKHEEGESLLAEIESIGQSYEDMQSQNQHLLQQITERDDYNIKLVTEGVKARQLEGALRTEIETMDKEIKHANSMKELYNLKVARLDDQLKFWSEQIIKLAEDARQNSAALENAQMRLLDVQTDSKPLRDALDVMQTKIEGSRIEVAALQIELEKERFNKKRVEEEVDVVTRKATGIRTKTEGSATLERLQQEIKEYRGILKCGVCHDRQKEVVIAKCYHLFCSQCVQKTLESRHRKCPTCATSFGPNDVKSIYI